MSNNTLDELLIKGYIDDLAFELSLPPSLYEFDYRNIIVLRNALNKIEADYKNEIEANIDAKTAFNQIENWLLKLQSRPTELTKFDLKDVFMKVRYGEIQPIGSTDSSGRFWLKDGDLLPKSCRPTAKYPYKQFNNALTSDFVKAVADKYNCKNKAELLSHFTKYYNPDFKDLL